MTKFSSSYSCPIVVYYIILKDDSGFWKMSKIHWSMLNNENKKLPKT